jgi:hypothetical protein
MSFSPAHIDPQHLHLDALMEDIGRAIDEGAIAQDNIEYIYEREPESHVFYGADLDGAYDDPEEAREIVMMVGGRDLDAKIQYWTGILAGAARGDWS